MFTDMESRNQGDKYKKANYTEREREIKEMKGDRAKQRSERKVE